MADRVLLNHLGLTVTDAARSRRFYEELLDFDYWWTLEAPDELAAKVLMLPPPIGLVATYLRRPDLVLELMCFTAPAAREAWRARRLNALGLTHLSFAVDDLDAFLARVPELGGQVEWGSQGPKSAWGQSLFIRDPDGQLIEIGTMEWRQMLPG